VIDQGVAGVVAMRYTVYVVTAARFVGELYASLLAGQQLGEAVSRGRQHLAADPIREIALRPLALQDWMVPIVYEAAPLAVVATPTTGQLTIEVGRAATGHKTVEAETTLPGPPEVGFYGRDETLLALDRAFDSQRVVLLHAFAGAGKTTTAAEFARWYQRTGGLAHEGGDGPVLFTAFTRHRPLALVLDQVGQVFDDGLQTAGVPWGALDEGRRRQVAVQVLSQVPVLWIWDNVELVAGFPEGTPSAWSPEEQRELRGFLVELQQTKATVLLTSRRQEHRWLGELPARVALPPMPMAERVQLARAVAAKRPGHQLDEVEDWRPLLAYSRGNPLTLTVLVGQALREGLRTREQVEGFVARLRAGEQHLADDEREGRSRSLGASLGYGFTHAFSEAERAQLALLHLFQGVVAVDVLCSMGDPTTVGEPVEAVRGLTREQGITLLDRAAEIGLLSSHGGGYYAIHPALPWYFTELFTTAYGPADSPAAQHATHAYTSGIADVGNDYVYAYVQGRREAIVLLGAEEANLLHARRLARSHGWWDEVMGAMQGLRVLYEYGGRRVEWARLVEELVPDLVDPATDGPRPGGEHLWSVFTEFRVQLAREHQRDYATAARLQRAAVARDRERAAAALAMPPDQLDGAQRTRISSLASSLHELGQVLREQQQPSCAEAYREALQLYRRVGDRQAAVPAYNLGNTYVVIPELRNLDLAERWYQYSIDLQDEADRLGRAKCIYQLGFVHLERYFEARAADRPEAEQLAHLNAAARAYHDALDLLPADAIQDLVVVHHQLGSIYDRGGQPATALRHWQESIRHQEKQGNRYGAAQTRYNVALALARRGRFEDALLWTQAALRDFQAYGDQAAADIAQTQQLITDIEQAASGGGT
jgi:tetratricopeptide (TPR) repeat protein